MTKRIFRSIFLVACAVLLACFVLFFGVLYAYFTGIQQTQLRIQAALAARGVELSGLDYLAQLEDSDARLTWISPDGTVLFDNRAGADEMENHLDREEIREALGSGWGESARTSATLAEKTLYRAQRLSDGSVLRVAVTQRTVLAFVMGMLQPILLVFVVALVLSLLLARRVARRIVQPLNELDLDRPLENEAYEELTPLLTHIQQQHRQIDEQLKELSRKRQEFTAITDSMREGLILLNEQGSILSINRAAAALFGTDERCVGRDILTLDRSLDLQQALLRAQNGQHAELVTDLAGGKYQIDASPVPEGQGVRGVVLLTFDVSERELAEQRRREFSANVSHELKTPLQSIMGSAELLENGLVRPEDQPRFFGHIRREADRLVTLVDDIIRLSQLDEGGELPREPLDLLTLAQEAVQPLEKTAQEHEVTLRVCGESVPFRGVRRLLCELIYNLCDNAVKYNRPGGRVEVTVRRVGAEAQIQVADTGIGIAPEHCSRVFERFYRVDKSHSRATGGTGLGLSIVKHVAADHGGQVELQSEPGRGTTVLVHLPLD